MCLLLHVQRSHDYRGKQRISIEDKNVIEETLQNHKKSYKMHLPAKTEAHHLLELILITA